MTRISRLRSLLTHIRTRLSHTSSPVARGRLLAYERRILSLLSELQRQ